MDRRMVALQTLQDRIDLLVRGELFASYGYGPEHPPGFTAIYAPGWRAVMRGDRSSGYCIGHPSVNGVAFLPDSGASGGRIVPVSTVARRGRVTVGFQQTCEWLDPQGEVLLRDYRTVRVLPGPGEGRILDFEVRFAAPFRGPVEFGPSCDGFVCAQVVRALFSPGLGQLSNSFGDCGPEAVDDRTATWCAGMGVVDGLTVGFAWLDHPSNPWGPSTWRCRDSGALSPHPLRNRALCLDPGGNFTLRYRLHVHEGWVNPGWPDARLEDFARE